MAAFDLEDLRRRMDGAVKVLHQEFGGLRTGRASVNLLEPVAVEAYGGQMPLNQLATVSAPEARLLTVQVWDKTMVKAVDTAIRDGGLGLNPISEGQLIRVPIPELTEERRKELVKVAHKYAEQTRVAMRNVRHHGMDTLKQLEKDGEISKDLHRDLADDIQKVTDQYVAKVGEVLESKEQEIMQV